MSETRDDPGVNRRDFLKAAVVTAAAATATGAGAALVHTSSQSEPILSIGTLPVAESVVAPDGEFTAEMFSKLAAARAENVRLQASVDAIQRRLSAESSDNTTETLKAELDAATTQVGVLEGLLALYEQWAEVDVSEVVADGLNSVTDSIADLLGELPTLTEGVEVGRQALDELEEQIPLLEEGRHWLGDHLERLQRAFGAVEQLLEAAASAAGPFLQMLNEWFQDILKWLPFGLGQRAGEIMQAIADVMAETPNTVGGLTSRIAQPLDMWLDGGGEEVPLRRNLVKPLREQVLDKASRTAARAEMVQTIYETNLAQPARTAVGNQAAIRESIAAYRKRHQI